LRRKTYTALIVVPILAYLLVLYVVAALVRPPALGWYGLAVVTAITLTLMVVALRLYPRSRVNAIRARPRRNDGLKLLVMVDAHTSNEAFARAVEATCGGRPSEVLVVAPLLADRLHFAADDEGEFQEDARVRLHESLQALARAGIDARGQIGDDDPLTAIGDALAAFPAAEILVLAPESDPHAWLEDDLEHRVRDLYGVHVTFRKVAVPAEVMRS
jgi:hypothetical protein